jgi:hypothetical protein
LKTAAVDISDGETIFGLFRKNHTSDCYPDLINKQKNENLDFISVLSIAIQHNFIPFLSNTRCGKKFCDIPYFAYILTFFSKVTL